MNSPTIAIAWELWSRNRWATTTVALAIPFLALVNSSWLGEWFRIVEILLFFFSITTLFWTFCCVEPDARGRHGGFPARMFVLPLATVRLLLTPTIGGALTIAVVYCLWAQFIFTPSWGIVVEPSTLCAHLLTIAASLFSLQAIVWSLHRFVWIRLALVVGALIGIGMLGLGGAGKGFRDMSEAAVLSTLGLISAVAFAGAVFGVYRDRCGEWYGWMQRLIDSLLAFRPRRQKPFSSSRDAQVWFEWRGKAFFFSALLALPMLVALMLYPLPTMLHFDPVMAAGTYANLPLFALIIAWCIGIELAKTYSGARESDISPFVATRPLTDGDIVVAKLKTAALVIAAATAGFAVLSVPAFNTLHWFTDSELHAPSWSAFKAHHPKLLLGLTHPVVLLTAAALAWATMAEGLAIGLGGQTRVILPAATRVSAFTAALIAFAVLAKRPGGLHFILSVLPWASAALLIGKIAATFLWYRRARGLYSRAQRFCLAALWLFVSGCIIATAALIWTGVPAFDRAIVFAAAFLAPGSAIFRAASNFHGQRHA